jgi:molecular chaperone IbpA
MASGINNIGGYPKGSPHEPWEKPKVIQQFQTLKPTVQDPFSALQNMLAPWTFGFERQLDMFKELEIERIYRGAKGNYPPYNIKHLPDNKAQIELAIAGFTKDSVSITYKENLITVVGERPEEEGTYAHKGIAGRNFEQKFAIADDVVVNGATLKDGLLIIDLERIIPEDKKEKVVKIK